ncbi:MAG TPA: methylated-DNA--[protein]-cysteine S-methyltransferase [Mycobacteriales bacterium]|nr:methylated-DNA--[protein]-cysteine S-methyltransferase [Mycobacteriales bacterium]
MTTSYTVLPSPIGRILLTADEDGALTGLRMEPHDIDPGWISAPGVFAEVTAQLTAYFAGELREFDVAIAPRGTDFQQRVWAALREIPYGETSTYGALAVKVGRPTAARAVGMANGRNPISLIVPCHRVIGANGKLVGFGGGVDRKRLLLDLESSGKPGSQQALL